jgi:hypothetical protein
MVWTFGKDGRQQGEYARELEFYYFQQWLRAVLTVMTIETPQIMKVMTVFPSSPTLLPRGEKGVSS